MAFATNFFFNPPQIHFLAETLGRTSATRALHYMLVTQMNSVAQNQGTQNTNIFSFLGVNDLRKHLWHLKTSPKCLKLIHEALKLPILLSH
jgi:hypothetical protein